MDCNDSSSHRWLGRLLIAVLGTACTAREPTDDDGSRSCGEIASAMVEQCADEHEALTSCIDVASVEACDQQNLAHGECIEVAQGAVTMDEHDAAFARYLCEVAEEPADDCDMRIAACP